MTVSDLFAWAGSRFKWDQPTKAEAKAAKKRDADRQWRKVCKAVDERDRGWCRVCRRITHVGMPPTNPYSKHRHHIIFRSQGGLDKTWNVVTLCGTCHGRVHARTLRVEGNADTGLLIDGKLERGA